MRWAVLNVEYSPPDGTISSSLSSMRPSAAIADVWSSIEEKLGDFVLLCLTFYGAFSSLFKKLVKVKQLYIERVENHSSPPSVRQNALTKIWQGDDKMDTGNR